MSNFDLDKSKEEKARDLYQTYVSNYSSNLIFGKGEEEPIGKIARSFIRCCGIQRVSKHNSIY